MNERGANGSSQLSHPGVSERVDRPATAHDVDGDAALAKLARGAVVGRQRGDDHLLAAKRLGGGEMAEHAGAAVAVEPADEVQDAPVVIHRRPGRTGEGPAIVGPRPAPGDRVRLNRQGRRGTSNKRNRR